MAGKRQKHPDMLAFRRGGRGQALTVLDEAAARPLPRAPEGIGEYARRAWKRYWGSPVSQIVDMDAHGETLRYWARCLDARQKLWGLWRDRPLVKGSHNQVMVNPVWRQIRDLSDEIHRIEEAFGMTPLAQMRLGITFLHQRSLRQRMLDQLDARPHSEVIDLDALEAEKEDPREYLRQQQREPLGERQG